MSLIIPHYTYLVLKILVPSGIIIVNGIFGLLDMCDKEFHKMAQAFGMTAEYERLRGDTDHNVLPDVDRSLLDQAFNSTRDAKKIWAHPTNLNKTTSIVVDLDLA
jgi:hypothetical protein